MNPAPTVALVDFASLVPGPKSEGAYLDAIELLWELILEVVQPRRADEMVHEVQCRLYGGWFARDGSPTEQYAWILRNTRHLRGLRTGVRVVPTIIEALLCRPGVRLWGTYKNKRQKMVDHMLALDALSVARDGENPCILIISDDEDYTPVVLTIETETAAQVCWLRQHEPGSNDQHFDQSRVELMVSELWK